MKINNRIVTIQEYHFKRIEDIKEKLKLEGRNIFDFGIGDPDIPVHGKIKSKLIEALEEKDFNKYPPYEGIRSLKLKIMDYYNKIYNVDLDEDEVVILIGSKEGLNNIIPAVCDIGDHVIIPQPGYPVYETCSRLWGVIPYKMPLIYENGYLPRIKFIPENITRASKLMILNYPNNPTGAVLNKEFIKEVKDYCLENNIVLCNDGAYNEIIDVSAEDLSILQGGIDNCIEFGTFSKTFSMTGFRIGYAVGDKNIIRALLKIKTNVDSGQFMPIQEAASEALDLDRSYVYNVRETYFSRRGVMEEILTEKGIEFFSGKGTFYVWCKVPRGYTTDEFCEELLLKYGVIVTPGYVFGKLGYGFFRIALTKEVKIIKEAFKEVNL